MEENSFIKAFRLAFDVHGGLYMKLPGQDTCTLGEYTKTYRGNRRHLSLVYENLPLPDSELWEMSANPLPLEAGPMSRTMPRAETT